MTIPHTEKPMMLLLETYRSGQRGVKSHVVRMPALMPPAPVMTVGTNNLQWMNGTLRLSGVRGDRLRQSSRVPRLSSKPNNWMRTVRVRRSAPYHGYGRKYRKESADQVWGRLIRLAKTAGCPPVHNRFIPFRKWIRAVTV